MTGEESSLTELKFISSSNKLASIKKDAGRIFASSSKNIEDP